MEKLFKVSLIISLAGVFLLLLLSNILEPKHISIGEINDMLIDKKVKVQGEIFNIKSYKDSNFEVISIKDNTGKIDITLNEILNITNTQKIIVTGTVQEYKGYLQIQADKIVLR
jgi:DNA/RNA endonuclease YhcR with UshA esterase domain